MLPTRRGRVAFGLARLRIALVAVSMDGQVGGEAQHVVLPVAQAFQQVPAGLLLAAGHARDLGQAEQDAVPERVDQQRGDIGRDCWQALGAGGVRGVDPIAPGNSGRTSTTG
jgi:hypothetical protein